LEETTIILLAVHGVVVAATTMDAAPINYNTRKTPRSTTSSSPAVIDASPLSTAPFPLVRTLHHLSYLVFMFFSTYQVPYMMYG
jgi:hypothetical protein